MWAGLPDPDTRLQLSERADDETEQLQQLLDMWPGCITVAEAVRTDTIYDFVTTLKGEPKRALGNLLKQYRGRVLGGKCFERTDSKTPQWFVAEVVS